MRRPYGVISAGEGPSATLGTTLSCGSRVAGVLPCVRTACWSNCARWPNIASICTHFASTPLAILLVDYYSRTVSLLPSIGPDSASVRQLL